MSTPTMDDLNRVSPIARRLRAPAGRTALAAALSRSWLLVPLGVSLGVRENLCRAWAQWCRSRGQPAVMAVLLPRDSFVRLEMPDPYQLSAPGLAVLDQVMRGANRRNARWGSMGASLDCETADAPVAAAAIWDIAVEYKETQPWATGP